MCNLVNWYIPIEYVQIGEVKTRMRCCCTPHCTKLTCCDKFVNQKRNDLNLTKNDISYMNHLLIMNSQPDFLIIQIMDVLKRTKNDLDAQRMNKYKNQLQRIMLSVSIKDMDNQFRDIHFHKVVKLYFIAGTMLNNVEYIHHGLSMLRNRYNDIPNLLIFEAAHSKSDHLLISGYLRKRAHVTKDGLISVICIESIVSKYFVMDGPAFYTRQLLEIYLKAERCCTNMEDKRDILGILDLIMT